MSARLTWHVVQVTFELKKKGKKEKGPAKSEL
jgi:hypothetical protein